jgi:hypothetical protein
MDPELTADGFIRYVRIDRGGRSMHGRDVRCHYQEEFHDNPGSEGAVHRPDRGAVWIPYSAVLLVVALIPLVAGLDAPGVDRASTSVTTTFVVLGLGTPLNVLTNRRDPTRAGTAA